MPVLLSIFALIFVTAMFVRRKNIRNGDLGSVDGRIRSIEAGIFLFLPMIIIVGAVLSFVSPFGEENATKVQHVIVAMDEEHSDKDSQLHLVFDDGEELVLRNRNVSISFDGKIGDDTVLTERRYVNPIAGWTHIEYRLQFPIGLGKAVDHA